MQKTTITSDRKVLKDKEMNFVDMHHHSNVSDGSVSPEIIAKAAKKMGFGVCLADHNEARGSVYLSKISKKEGFFTVPAIEVTTRQSKDILAYFYSAKDLQDFWENEIRWNVKNNLVWNLHKTTIDTEDILEKIKEYGGVSALPHPLTLRPKNAKDLLKKKFLKKIGMVESHNYVLGKYEETMNVLKGIGKPLIAGSDSHTISRFDTMTGAKSFDVEGFMNEILKKRNIIFYEAPNSLHQLYERIVIVRNNVCISAKRNVSRIPKPL